MSWRKLILFPRGILVTLTILLAGYLNSQTFRFRNYDSNIGLPQNFVYSIVQDNKGFLWIGTGEGLVKYDGIRFTPFSRNDSLADDFVMSMLVGVDGRLWVGHNNGQMSINHEGLFTPFKIPGANSPVQDIVQDAEGNTWAVIQNSGFVKIDKDGEVTSWFDMGQLDFTLYYSIFPLDNNELLLGTSDGLLKLTVTNDGKIEGLERFFEIPSTTINNIKAREGKPGEFWIGTQDEGFFHFSLQESVATSIINRDLCINFNLQYENIQDIEETPEGHVLLATWGNGVIKLYFDPEREEFIESLTFSTTSGLGNNFVRDILSDAEGNYWFATYGGGVSSLVDESMIFFNLSTIGFQQSMARSVFKAPNRLWLGLEDGLIVADPFCITNFEYYDTTMGLPRDMVTGFYKDARQTIWVATANSGLYFREKGQFNFRAFHYTTSNTGKKINGITGHENYVWLATTGGFFQINTTLGTINQLTTESGLPHNNINFVYRTAGGELWIGPKNSGIARIESRDIEIHRITDSPTDVFGMTLDKNDNIWLATQGRGVIKYMLDSMVVIGVQEGLARNFCYGIIADEYNRLWITHFPGLSSIDLNTGKIRTFDHRHDLGSDFHQVISDEEKNLWFASNHGVIKYIPSKDKENMIPPNLSFTTIKVSGIEHRGTNRIELPFPYRERHNLRFEFIGISLSNPDAVTYQYRLKREGDSQSPEWVNLGTTTFKEYDFLPDGEFTLQIRAFNADGIYNVEPLAIQIYIAAPIWKKAWFYLIIGAILIGLVYLLITTREKKLRRQKETLQREVNSQTIILREQKAEIERKNRDITDSINYAKRIQSSILPPFEILDENFDESFIFFAPRDIVSGDFYWFHKFKGKYLICAADCTGHGVPGAFMSMIGTTLLNDIVKRDEINSPADILRQLDLEIKILLQKNSSNTTRDGMEIALIEVDRKKSKVTISSAKRPVHLIINGKLVIHKGNRRSIGDSIMEDDSDFTNIEYLLSPKDAVYTFSDGFPDQFGGPEGRKFMSVKVRKLIEEIHHEPMKEQLKIIRSQFYTWMGEKEQVDDVVFIGFRV